MYMFNRLLKHPKDLYTILYLSVLAGIKILAFLTISQIFPLLTIFLGFVTFLILSIRHNIAHYSIFWTNYLNKGLNFLLCILTGVSSKGLEMIHVKNHHQFVNNKNDWGQTSPYRHSREWLNFIHYIIKTPFIFIRSVHQVSAPSHNPRSIDWEIAIVLLNIIICLILFWKQTIFYVILPYIIGQILLVSFNYFQHRGCDDETIFKASRNFTGKWINRLTMNNGYHTAHHLHAHKHWSEYPAIHKKIENRIPKELNQSNFFSYFWKEILIAEYPIQIPMTR